MITLQDIHQRSFKTLRISLLDICNMSCIYCTCGTEDIKQNFKAAKGRSLPVSNLIGYVRRLHELLNFETIRLTGGEPLLYPHLIELIEGIGALGPALKLTTNGILLEKMAEPLRKAGISSVNVSLDAIEEHAFSSISRTSNVQRVLRGILEAKDVGIHVKLNAVVMRGVNENQVLPLASFAFEHGLTLRFLEIMAMGHLFNRAEQSFFSQADILEVMSNEYNFIPLPRRISSTANYWKTAQGDIFGIVANESHPFCSDCNRLRLDSFGNIYGCLSDDTPIALSEDDAIETLKMKLQRAMNQKQEVKFQGSPLSMLQIGG